MHTQVLHVIDHGQVFSIHVCATLEVAEALNALKLQCFQWPISHVHSDHGIIVPPGHKFGGPLKYRTNANVV
jgi:hypothetical protein